jgi:uncharacterized membrane protein YbaN (DUF454 family)
MIYTGNLKPLIAMGAQCMSRLIRWPSLLLAYLFLLLAVIGIPTPGLPTVPFLLLSAWFAARGSKRLHHWLYAHPHFGAILINWEQQGAVSRRSKVIAVIMLLASWGFMFWRSDNVWLLSGLALLFTSVTIFLWTRPEPS